MPEIPNPTTEQRHITRRQLVEALRPEMEGEAAVTDVHKVAARIWDRLPDSTTEPAAERPRVVLVGEPEHLASSLKVADEAKQDTAP